MCMQTVFKGDLPVTELGDFFKISYGLTQMLSVVTCKTKLLGRAINQENQRISSYYQQNIFNAVFVRRKTLI